MSEVGSRIPETLGRWRRRWLRTQRPRQCRVLGRMNLCTRTFVTQRATIGTARISASASADCRARWVTTVIAPSNCAHVPTMKRKQKSACLRQCSTLNLFARPPVRNPQERYRIAAAVVLILPSARMSGSAFIAITYTPTSLWTFKLAILPISVPSLLSGCNKLPLPDWQGGSN